MHQVSRCPARPKSMVSRGEHIVPGGGHDRAVYAGETYAGHRADKFVDAPGYAGDDMHRHAFQIVGQIVC